MAINPIPQGCSEFLLVEAVKLLSITRDIASKQSGGDRGVFLET
jgi:hypothetical protein